jgi:AraC-like DNA-binding protein
VSDVVERYRSASLLVPPARARVMRPVLDDVDVHWHDFYELSLVLDGRARHLVNGDRSEIGPGSAFLLSPADLHAIHPLGTDPLRCFNTVVEPDLVEGVLARLGGLVAAFPWRADGCLDLAPDLERLERELVGQDVGAGVVSEALVTGLVVELARRNAGAAPAVRGRSDSDTAMRQVLLYVDRHFREPLSLADLAAQAHLSPNYCSERFRDIAGVSFQSYLLHRRLQFARSLLEATALGVTEICHASGFNDVSHFGRVYRRRYGVPPSGGRRGGSPA